MSAVLIGVVSVIWLVMVFALTYAVIKGADEL